MFSDIENAADIGELQLVKGSWGILLYYNYNQKETLRNRSNVGTYAASGHLYWAHLE